MSTEQLTPEEKKIYNLTQGKRTSPRFNWKKDDGDDKCWICEAAAPRNEYFCCESHRKAALKWNTKFNPKDAK